MTAYTRPVELGVSPAWHREADDHRPTTPPRLVRLDLGDEGYVDFVDEHAVHPDGQIVVVAVGRRAVERAGFFIKNAGATPQELFMALAPAQEAAPSRLLEDHLDRVAKDRGVEREPRTLATSAVFRNYSGPTLGRTTFYEIYTASSDEDPLGCIGYPSHFFIHWAMYDNGAVEDFVDWPSGYAFIENVTQRALALCYYPPSNGGGLINVWIESGIGGFYPTIWSAVFEPDHFVWFKTGTYLAKGISHLHWSDLEPGTGHVRLLGTWSDY